MRDKKYLLRTPHDPFTITPYSELHANIGNNVGNLVYVAGVTRALMISDNTVFVKNRGDYTYTEGEIDEINQTYDAFIISLADALRSSYRGTLGRMTELIKKLKIPCVVIGCGLRANYEPRKDLKYPFDSEAKEFFAAVLDKSARIGLRGQITADYLKHLGFKEEKDYTVIGCPSLYMYGGQLPYDDTVSTFLSDRNAACSFNISPKITQKTYDLIADVADQYKNSVYIPQNSKDEILMYYGKPFEESKRIGSWPSYPEHPFYRDHKVLFFNNPLSWIEFQKSCTLSMGTRVHGNITGVLAGTPTLFLPQSARPRELCEYHGFANITPQELEKTDSLPDRIASLDFEKPKRMQAKNFEHYLEFLRINGLSNIFDEQIEGETPYDKRTADFAKEEPLEAVKADDTELIEARRREFEKKNSPKNTPLIERLRRKVRKYK